MSAIVSLLPTITGDAAVRPPANRVRAVLLDAAGEPEHFHRVDHVVAIGVVELDDRRRAGCRRLRRPPPRPPCAGGGAFAASSAAASTSTHDPYIVGPSNHRPWQLRTLSLMIFSDFVDAVLVVVEQDPRVVLLLRDDQASLAVEGDDDVAVVLVGRVDALDAEAGQRAELHAGHGLRDQARLVRRLTLPAARSSAATPASTNTERTDRLFMSETSTVRAVGSRRF